MKKKKSDIVTFILVAVLLVGLSLLLYPSVSDYWNSFHSSRAIASYSEEIAKLNEEKFDQLWQEAYDYNASLLERSNGYILDDRQKQQYNNIFNVLGNGLMGYIEIPSIKVELPIYHGTEESVLQIAVGHLDWTSLPAGGTGTHCVLSGHRGLTSARLFTDLDKLDVGDVFMLCVLNDTLTYEVDKISIVEPQETGSLLIDKNEDYCTLVTCTPYGVNTHRMLVRGHRIANADDASVRVTADAVQIEPIVAAPMFALPILLVLLIALLFPSKSKKKNGGDYDD